MSVFLMIDTQGVDKNNIFKIYLQQCHVQFRLTVHYLG